MKSPEAILETTIHIGEHKIEKNLFSQEPFWALSEGQMISLGYLL